MTHKYLALREIAAELRISREAARQAVLDGHIEAKQVRDPWPTWRVEAKDFRAYKSHRNGDAEHEPAEDAIEKPG